MKQPLPTKRTWAGRGPRQLKSAGLSASHALRLAQAVSRATLSDPGTEPAIAADPTHASQPPSRLLEAVRPDTDLPVTATPIANTAVAHQQAQRLEAQAARVEQLSQELRAAMAELKALTRSTGLSTASAQVSESSAPAQEPPPPHVPEPAIAAPTETATSVAPVLPVTGAPTPQVHQAQQEATATAQFLRRLKRRQSQSKRLRVYRSRQTSRSPRQVGLWSWRSLERQVYKQLRPPVGTTALLSDAAVWLVMAAAVRVGLKGVLASYLWAWGLLGVVIAAIALVILQKIWVNARSGTICGYRFFLVLLGLLVGGQL